MNKKGFTLIELMGVLIVLLLILLIVFPSIINVVKGSGNKIDSATELIIKSSAKDYVEDYKDVLFKSSNSVCISIKKLIDSGYLTMELKSGTDNKEVDTERGIQIEIKEIKNGDITERIEYGYTILDGKCN